MIDLIKSLLSKPVKPQVIPLELEAPPDWTATDTAEADAFFNRGAGVKMRKILYYEVVSESLRTGKKDDFQQGYQQGKNAMLARILNLSEVEENTDNA